MSDLISRADAIKAIRKCKFDSDMPSYWYRGMEDAQDIIENIPSAELPKGDLISRKVLMDRLESFCKWCKDGRLQGAEFVWDCIVPNVPSAEAEEYDDYEHATLVDIKEPLKVEVVRCKDCKHRDLFSCPLTDNDFQKDEDFCSWGERREP